MMRPRRFALLTAGAAALLTAGIVFGIGVEPVSAAGTVTTVTSSAYGFRTFDITIFGGAQNGVGPSPTVTLASNASASPRSAAATTGLVQYGPATLLTADGITVQAAGALGTTGTATSKSSVNHINRAGTQTSTGSEPLTAGVLSGSCSASTSRTTGSTTITAGTLHTDSGLDVNGNGSYTDPGDHPPVTVALPANPAPNTTIAGVVYTSATAKDSFHFVFNEQSRTASGVLTVNPVHEYFDGPILKGNLIIGQVVCGVTVSAASASTSTSTTEAPSPSASATTSASISSTTTSSSTALTSSQSTTSAQTPVTTPATATGGGGGRTGAVIGGAGGGLLLAAGLVLWWRRGRGPRPTG